MAKIEPCKWCSATCYWLAHERTGNVAPINFQPDPKGNIAIDGDTYRIVKKGEEYDGARYMNHWATCPKAHEHEGEKKAKKAAEAKAAAESAPAEPPAEGR